MKTRFAPSPTGLIHFGNLRTALFNFLLAKSKKGKILLRVEDTDQSRSKQEYVDLLLEDLKKVYIEFDEGPVYQSDRTEVYKKYYQKLQDENLAYPCFCTESELSISRKSQLQAGLPPRYSGKCRNLSESEIVKKFEQGLSATLRFQMPKNEVIEFNDLIKGPQKFSSNDIGDFIIRRADGSASFMFANAIDDSEMEVTHALRGDDHLTNTPRQVAILQALKLRAPEYGHFPLIYGMDGAPLSKRNGSASVKELLDKGYLPIALLNYLARLGHYYETNSLLSINKLSDLFDLQNVNKSPAKHDVSQLKYWQKEAIMQESVESLWTIIRSQNLSKVNSFVPENKQHEFVEVIRPNLLMPEEADIWAEAFFAPELHFPESEVEIIKDAGREFFALAVEALSSGGVDNFSDLTELLKNKLNVKGKKLFLPLRIALTGQTYGPEMPLVLQLMGKELAISRFEKAINKC